VRFTYLGPEGTFSEQALRTIPDAEHAELIPARSVSEALDAVRVHQADGAMVPLENSVGGSVPDTMAELAMGEPLLITREVIIPVNFVLAIRPGIRADQIRVVAAHPQAAAQCRNWLRAHLPQATVVDMLSNATAAAAVAHGKYDAAVSSRLAVQRHDLPVLAENIADQSGAMTRFVLMCRPGPPPPPTGNDLTSLAVFIAHDRVGALLEVLTQLAVRGINLTRIASQPTGEQLGRYCFLLDCNGHVAEARMGEALMGLRRICAAVRFLGSYPRAREDKPVRPPTGTSDADFADAATWLAKLRESGTAD